MTKYHQCKHLETTIKVMSRGTLFELYCNKNERRPNGRECKDCIYKGEHK